MRRLRRWPLLVRVRSNPGFTVSVISTRKSESDRKPTSRTYHSITSSALMSSEDGKSTPRVLVAFKLILNSNFVG